MLSRECRRTYSTLLRYQVSLYVLGHDFRKGLPAPQTGNPYIDRWLVFGDQDVRPNGVMLCPGKRRASACVVNVTSRHIRFFLRAEMNARSFLQERTGA
jgi:hypothetical protein